MGGAEKADGGAPRRPQEELEIRSGGSEKPRAVGRLHGRLRGRAAPLLHEVCALVRGSRRPQVVPQLAGQRHPGSCFGETKPAIPAAAEEGRSDQSKIKMLLVICHSSFATIGPRSANDE